MAEYSQVASACVCLCTHMCFFLPFCRCMGGHVGWWVAMQMYGSKA